MSPRSRKADLRPWQLGIQLSGLRAERVALFVIVLLIVGCEMAIAGLERAYTYFEAKEYSWLVPGGMEKRV
jgi:hypothetical protein